MSGNMWKDKLTPDQLSEVIDPSYEFYEEIVIQYPTRPEDRELLNDTLRKFTGKTVRIKITEVKDGTSTPAAL